MRVILATERLILRTWKAEDAEAYFLINQDAKVIEFLPRSLTMQEVDDFIERVNKQQDERSYSLWAIELKETGEFIGFTGLNYTDFPADFTPAVEVGWRLGSQFWGSGYATEAAKAALDYGFNEMGLHEIVSFTVPANKRSINVMEKIGLKRDFAGDFAHPKLSMEHPLSQHVLYRIKKGNK
jgi:RimJ/RimL family protein N-acetyltransferase